MIWSKSGNGEFLHDNDALDRLLKTVYLVDVVFLPNIVFICFLVLQH